MNRHMRIGIFAGKVYRDINQLQIQGILKVAYSLGYSASVFTLNEEYYDERTDNGAYNIFNIVNFNKLDGIVYLSNTFSSEQCKNHIEAFLHKYCRVPVICTESSQEFITLWYNDRKEAEEIVSHLINFHGCRKILYLTGKENMYSSYERMNGYKDAMDKAGLPYSDDDIIFGDFWVYSGQNLGNDIASGKRPMPDAIACANDCMAVALCDTLISHGIRVPEDILITGYDGTDAAALHSPVITTYRPSWEGLGIMAMKKLYKEMTGKDVDGFPIPNGEIIHGESCGCGTPKHKPYGVSFNYEKFEGDYQDSSVSTILFSARSYRDFIVQLYTIIPFYLNPDNKKDMHYCLCLCEDWRQNKLDGYRDTYRTSGYSNKIISTDCIEKHVVFNSEDMLPSHITARKPSITYFSPCHFSDRCFGYNTITFYNQTCTFDLKYLRFCREVNNGLAFLVIQDELKGLAYSSHVARSRDLLTGLYNLESFPLMWEDISESAEVQDKDVFIIAISLKGLQSLLEISGTREKEKLIVAFSEMLMKCCEGSEKLFRIGDGDFAVIGLESSADCKHESIAARIETRFIEIDGVAQSSGSLHIRRCVQTIPVSGIPTASAARDVLLEMVESFTENSSSRSEQVYFKELVVLRREIYEFPENDWSLNICCEKLNISSNYFQKIYKKAFGVTCMHDIQRSKLDYAKKLLTHTNDTLQIIAERCGYNYSHFMRMFKKETGVTPTQYRSGKTQ